MATEVLLTGSHQHHVRGNQIEARIKNGQKNVEGQAILREVSRFLIDTGNIANWNSLKSRKVTQSPASELYYSLLKTLQDWSQVDIPDSENNSDDCFVKNKNSESLENEERGLYKVTVKVFLHKFDARYIKEAIDNVLQELKIQYVDTVYLALPPIDDKTPFVETITPFWRELERLQEAGITTHISSCDLDANRLKMLLDVARIRPEVNQVNLTSCCHMPEDLVTYAKHVNVLLHTHGDQPELKKYRRREVDALVEDVRVLLREPAREHLYSVKWKEMSVLMNRWQSPLKGCLSKLHLQRASSFLPSEIKSEELVIQRTPSPRDKPSSKKLVFGHNMSDHMFVVEWTARQGWRSPRIVPYGSIPIMPSASCLHYGLEVFEGLKAYRCVDGSIRLFRPEQNMNRFYNSAKRLSLPTFNRDELLKCMTELVRVDQDWIPNDESCSLYIRPTMISTEPTLGVKPPESAMLFIITGPVGPYFATGTFNPVSLLADTNFVRAWHGGIGECKAGGNYGPTILAQRIAASKGCSQCLWLYNDEVTEVGTMNFFMYWINENGEEELITPPLNGLILPGITRKSLLELAREWNDFKVSERTFTIHDIARGVKEGRIKEIFGAGTACVVCPVDQILFNEERIRIPSAENGGFKLAQRFYKELTDIQYARREHPWSFVVEGPLARREGAKQVVQ